MNCPICDSELIELLADYNDPNDQYGHRQESEWECPKCGDINNEELEDEIL